MKKDSSESFFVKVSSNFNKSRNYEENQRKHKTWFPCVRFVLVIGLDAFKGVVRVVI